MTTNRGVTTHDAEEWRPVEGWPGYEVSNLGGVRTQTRRVEDGRTVHGRTLRPWRNDKLGHLAVSLNRGGWRKTASVHRLVALAFLGYPPLGAEVCHFDGDPTNNRVDNLRWDTHAANMADAVRHRAEAVA